jgi:Tfp pilus assembly protein PilV
VVRNESPDAGFTVLEALIAFAILSLSLIALYESIGLAYRATGSATKREQLLALAKSELDVARTIDDASPKERSGKIADGGSWRIYSEPASTTAVLQGPQAEWLIFEATDADGKPALRLRDVRIAPNSVPQN